MESTPSIVDRFFGNDDLRKSLLIEGREAKIPGQQLIQCADPPPYLVWRSEGSIMGWMARVRVADGEKGNKTTSRTDFCFFPYHFAVGYKNVTITMLDGTVVDDNPLAAGKWKRYPNLDLCI